MALKYLPNGNLVPGRHLVSWQEFVEEFGYTNHRMQRIEGMKKALNYLKICNCERVFIDGSFVTKKLVPKDWDGCYDEGGMDKQKLRTEYPIFLDMTPPRERQKDVFKGEILPSSLELTFLDKTILDCFQWDDRDDSSKGIIELSLKNYIV